MALSAVSGIAQLGINLIESVRILGRLHHAFSEIVFVEALIGQQIDISRAKSGALVCI